MNRDEFNQWAKNFSASFPETANWLRSLPNTVATIDNWRQVLADVSLADSLAATRAILLGDEPPIAAYEREQSPTRIRSIARRIAGNRLDAESRRSERRLHSKRDSAEPFSCVAALAAAAEARKIGGDPKAAIREVVKSLPADDSYRNAYRCLRCRDTGTVVVWGEKAVSDMVAGRFENPKQYNYALAACECEAGEQWRRLRPANKKHPNEWRKLPQFDSTKHCRYDAIDLEASVLLLREFVDVAKNAVPENYVREFEEFNHGG